MSKSLSSEGYSDGFLHETIEENGEKEKERIFFPFTRYENNLNRPTVGESVKNSSNPDFLLVGIEEEELDDREVFELFKQEW